MTTAGGIATFNAGTGGVEPHQQDGMTARRSNIAVIPGVPLVLEVDIRALSATITGNIGMEMEPTRRPRWGFHLFDGATLIGEVIVFWASPQCQSCPTVASDLGIKTLAFATSASTLDLVVSGFHRSSQCASVVHDLRMDVDYILIRRP
ncbi:MAG: hypothetical protein AB7P03_09450 [Kofleriaceae bacterium]